MQQGETFSYAGPAVRTGDDGEAEVQVDGTFTVVETDAAGAGYSVVDARLADRSLGLSTAGNSYRVLGADVDHYNATPREQGQ